MVVERLLRAHRFQLICYSWKHLPIQGAESARQPGCVSVRGGGVRGCMCVERTNTTHSTPASSRHPRVANRIVNAWGACTRLLGTGWGVPVAERDRCTDGRTSTIPIPSATAPGEEVHPRGGEHSIAHHPHTSTCTMWHSQATQRGQHSIAHVRVIVCAGARSRGVMYTCCVRARKREGAGGRGRARIIARAQSSIACHFAQQSLIPQRMLCVHAGRTFDLLHQTLERQPLAPRHRFNRHVVITCKRARIR